jgi:hypothetical protein
MKTWPLKADTGLSIFSIPHFHTKRFVVVLLSLSGLPERLSSLDSERIAAARLSELLVGPVSKLAA